MPRIPERRVTITVFGGRADALTVPHARVLLFGSRRTTGGGDCRRLEAALMAGEVDGLVFWARFAGHSDGCRLLAAARRRGVPSMVVTGGRTSLKRAIAALVGGAR